LPDTPAPPVAGYSGVTASGAGFTGAAPVATVDVPAPPVSSYDAVVATGATNYPDEAAYPVTARTVVFTEAEGEAFVAPGEDGISRYATEWDIGPTTPLVTPEGAMTIMKDSPNVVFPFDVRGQAGETRIKLNSVYDLNNVRVPGDNGNPVLVVQSDPTSFTFLTLPGHFRGPGRTIKFQTLERDGRLMLRQEAMSEASIGDTVFDQGARLSWYYQASNLRAAIYGGERSDFPGAFPFPATW
jgi:hypothetical protein